MQLIQQLNLLASKRSDLADRQRGGKGYLDGGAEYSLCFSWQWINPLSQSLYNNSSYMYLYPSMPLQAQSFQQKQESAEWLVGGHKRRFFTPTPWSEIGTGKLFLIVTPEFGKKKHWRSMTNSSEYLYCFVFILNLRENGYAFSTETTIYQRLRITGYEIQTKHLRYRKMGILCPLFKFEER